MLIERESGKRESEIKREKMERKGRGAQLQEREESEMIAIKNEREDAGERRESVRKRGNRKFPGEREQEEGKWEFGRDGEKVGAELWKKGVEEARKREIV